MRALRRDRWLVAFVAWTAFVWVSRIRNIVGNEDLDGPGRFVRLLVVAAFLGLAAGVLARWRRPSRPAWVTALAAWTTGLWTVQMAGIVIDGHEASFVLVHAALAAVSVGLAGAAWRAERRAATEPRLGATV